MFDKCLILEVQKHNVLCWRTQTGTLTTKIQRQMGTFPHTLRSFVHPKLLLTPWTFSFLLPSLLLFSFHTPATIYNMCLSACLIPPWSPHFLLPFCISPFMLSTYGDLEPSGPIQNLCWIMCMVAISHVAKLKENPTHTHMQTQPSVVDMELFSHHCGLAWDLKGPF